VPVLLVAPLDGRGANGWHALLAHSLGMPPGWLAVAWLDANPEMLHQRLAARGAVRDRWKLAQVNTPELANWDAYVRGLALGGPDGPHLVVDAAWPSRAAAASAAAWAVQAWRQSGTGRTSPASLASPQVMVPWVPPLRQVGMWCP